MGIQIGKFNTLRFEREEKSNLVFSLDGENIKARKSDLTQPLQPGDEADLFVYTDSSGELTATEQGPYAEIDQCGFLRVKEETTIGAFLDWGIAKDLFVPFALQKDKMKEGYYYPVYVMFDEKSQRIVGTSKISPFVNNDSLTVREGDRVTVVLCNETDMGIKAIVNDKHWGLIYRNEIFRSLEPGQRLKGFVKKIREGNKIDISLQEQGYDEVFTASLKILEKLKKTGSMPLNDKSAPDEIYDQLEMSKKVFKKAIGALYKEKKILITEKGIQLIDKK